MTATVVHPHTRFTLPDELSATEPPEARGLARDGIRLLVASPEGIEHHRFHDIGSFLRAGDLLVVNTSATIPAAVDGVRLGRFPVVVHFSSPSAEDTWVVELRAPNASGPVVDASSGERVDLPGGAGLELVAPHGEGRSGVRLWRARLGVEAPVEAYLERFGRPITYAYLRGRWPLAAYQTIFAAEPGSAEMPSAGRPFTERLVTELAGRGVVVAPILLHCGVSSLEPGEAPQAERFRVPETTARLVNLTRSAGGRVVAVGTTVTRALETAARPDGTVDAAEGWTDLVIGPEHPVRVVDGLVTGWHGPDASHLLLLEAVAGESLVQEAYDAALARRYLWHEFGDSGLFLPSRPG
jgi:S-adenosylmethionine:tRNA ribosyltransferase-isomerase